MRVKDAIFQRLFLMRGTLSLGGEALVQMNTGEGTG
jgi:hypothetical protein